MGEKMAVQNNVYGLSEAQLKRLETNGKVNYGRGLSAIKRENGVIDWRFHHRVKGLDNAPTLTMGHFPEMDIDAAQVKAIEWRSLCAQGIHPRKHEQKSLEEKEAEEKKITASKVTLREAWVQYERRKKLGQKPNSDSTVRDRGYIIPAVLGDLLDKPVTELTGEMLEDCYYNYESQHGSHSTAGKALRYLNPILQFSVNVRGWIARNPYNQVRDILVTGSKKNLDRLTIPEIQRLLEDIGMLFHHPDEYIEKGWVTRAELTPNRMKTLNAVALLLLTGIRKRELLKLEIENVYLEEEEYRGQHADGPYFYIITSKQRQPFGVPITRAMASILRSSIAEAKAVGSKYVFPSARPGEKEDAPMDNERGAYPLLKRLMGKLSESEGNRISANVLRTTFASAALECGLTFTEINLITGHTGSIPELNRVATAAYVKVNAQNHRSMFDTVNGVMLDLDEPLGMPWSEESC